MEYYYFVIVVIIVLKILFWTFYFYVRAQRLRQTQTTHRFIIVGARPVTRARSHPYSDRSAIIDHAEPVSATGPPPYAEVVKDGSYPLPPSYDQAMTAPAAGANAPMSANNAPAFQSSAPTGGAGAMPVYSHVPGLAGGNSAMSGDSPAASQVNSCPTGHSQFGGQVAPGMPVSVGQNIAASQH